MKIILSFRKEIHFIRKDLEQSFQFYIIPIQIIEEDAILNYYFEAKCACLAVILDSISGHAV